MIRAIGPDTIFIQRFGITSFAGGAEFKELIKRPNLSISDARALEEQTATIQFVDIELGAGGPPTQRRVFYGTQKTKNLVVFGTTENFAEGTRIPILGGRFFNGTEVQYRKNAVVLGYTPYSLLFAPNGIDPIGKSVRVGSERFEVVGYFDKRPAAGGFYLGQDDFVVISSIALMVGGIGVMAIMSISVTERTREIGVRKALGARRAEILFQFLMEAAFLTSVGGLIGIGLGAGIGWAVHVLSGFPISLPWWSFAIGLGFSASVGIFFGMWPAFKASRLDPIEALRYE